MVMERERERDTGRKRRIKEDAPHPVMIQRRGQTAPLNYRLMKTLREMKSLSDGASPPAGAAVNEAMGRRVPRAFSNLYGQPDWELSLAGAFSKLLPPRIPSVFEGFPSKDLRFQLKTLPLRTRYRPLRSWKRGRSA